MTRECSVASNRERQKGRRILIAEDDNNFRGLLGRFFETFGFEVKYAENGKRAYELFVKEGVCVDAVVLDFHMPEYEELSERFNNYDKEFSVDEYQSVSSLEYFPQVSELCVRARETNPESVIYLFSGIDSSVLNKVYNKISGIMEKELETLNIENKGLDGYFVKGGTILKLIDDINKKLDEKSNETSSDKNGSDPISPVCYK